MAERIINGIPFDANAIIDVEGEVSYDYVLFAADLANWLATYFGNGILVPKGGVISTELQVTKTGSASVSIGKGNIVINGRTGFLPSPYEMTVNYASSGKQRIDRIVIELNTNEEINEFRPLLIKGNEVDSSPSIPALIRDDYLNIYQMSLARLLVTEDGIQNVIDERIDDNFCGISQVLIGIKPPIPVTGDSATNISYDNSISGLSAQNVQDAIDELSSQDTAANISYDNSVSGLSGTTVQDAIDELSSQDISKTLLSSGWGSDNTQTLTISGFTPNMKSPIVDVVPTSKEDNELWGNIWKVETGLNSLKFYATEPLSSDLNIIVKVVR